MRYWTREVHQTKSAARKNAEQKNSGSLNESIVKGVESNVASSIREMDPRNYQETSQSKLKSEGDIAMAEDLEADEEN